MPTIHGYLYRSPPEMQVSYDSEPLYFHLIDSLRRQIWDSLNFPWVRGAFEQPMMMALKNVWMSSPRWLYRARRGVHQTVHSFAAQSRLTIYADYSHAFQETEPAPNPREWESSQCHRKWNEGTVSPDKPFLPVLLCWGILPPQQQ